VTFTVNSNKASNFNPPEFTGFELLAGPYQSTSSSYSVNNGVATSSVQVTYTYTLQCSKAGDFKLAPASIIVNGEKYSSNGLVIKVLPPDSNSDTQQNAQQQNATAGQGITSDNLFIRASLSKSNVYEQEALTLTYKLYTLVDVVQYAPKKMPDFKDFLKQEFEQTNANRQLSYENHNGKNYATIVLYQVLLHPQKSGEITIDKAVFDVLVRVQNRSARRSIFDDFFESYTNVQKTIEAPAVKVTVNPLPAGKPAGFTETVGRFQISSSISAKEINVNDAVTLKITISGNGNMKLIKTPEIHFADGFETFEPKINNNFNTTISGITGTKSIEYVFIPRYAGNFDIPAVDFSYFDINDKKYKTLHTDEYKLKVLKSDGVNENPVVAGNYVNKEDVKALASDIRYIETGNINLYFPSKPLISSVFAWLLYLIIFVLGVVCYVVLRKNIRQRSSIEFVKNKRANRIAKKRLKVAKRLLEQGKKDGFYEEILKALWNYLGDKLNIEAALLAKENVSAELAASNVSQEMINELLELLNTCEYARYAPSDNQNQMGNLYDNAASIIGKLENSIKK
ncbi:MAG: BatD family protein, partial [Paludibacter sp.]|nr:BatD family protein [Paludibacter sp.]